MAAVYRDGRRSRVVVKRRRGGVELRVDGTLASFYAPGRFTTGPVWDALAASLLALPPERRRRILILGLGGGSAARTARALAPTARILGVELDPAVLRAARRWLDLDALQVEVVQGDAHDFLRSERRRFDAILEDVFVGRGRNVRKPDWLPQPGLDLAARRLRSGGVLTSNVLDEAPTVGRTLRRLFPRLVSVAVAGFDNRILVAGPRLPPGRELRRRLHGEPLLAPVLPELSFRTWTRSG
jgi:hypothetical protein